MKSTNKMTLVLLMFVLALNTGCRSSEESASADKPIEYKLAVIDGGGYVADNDIKIQRFRYLLDSLSEKTGETMYQIADMTAKGASLARERYGKQIKILELMERMNQEYSSGLELKYETAVILAVRDMAK
jgi:hypothetical protein